MYGLLRIARTSARPLCCISASKPLLCSSHALSRLCAPPPLAARPPNLLLALKREQAVAEETPVTFIVRGPADVVRLLARALWLGAVLVQPLMLLLPAVLLPDRFWQRLELAILQALQRGGPCTIKLGQWASTRPDVLPLSVCRTLASLHDDVPAHSLAHTHASIEAAFGRPVGELFASLDARAVGSGCIAQVHAAETLDGQRVAIKVLHPDVERQVAMDVLLLKAAAVMVERLLPLPGLRWLALAESVETFATFMASQLDLRREAANLERFRSNFAAQEGGEAAGVRFPRPLRAEGLVSATVLVETFVEGEVLAKALETTRRRRADAAAAATTLLAARRRLRGD